MQINRGILNNVWLGNIQSSVDKRRDKSDTPVYIWDIEKKLNYNKITGTPL